MERFLVEGGVRLHGEVEISGAKNAALKLVAAALLAPGKTVLRNVPRIKDVNTMLAVLEGLGAETSFHGHTLEIDASSIDSYTASYELVRQMRASIVVLGPLVARFGEAEVSAPGGWSSTTALSRRRLPVASRARRSPSSTRASRRLRT